MKKGLAAMLLCAAFVFAALNGSLAKKSKKKSKQDDEPPRPFVPPLPLPRIPPFHLASVTQKPSTVDPYACLPKYLCIISDKKGNKRTTILHGLHPALRKSKPDVMHLPVENARSVHVPMVYVPNEALPNLFKPKDRTRMS